MDITGSSAVVTGAASGIGAAVARQLAAAGATVVVADVQDDKGQALARTSWAVSFAHVDVTDTAQITAAVDAAGELAPLRVLVNSAGIGPAARTVGRDGTYDSAHDLDALQEGHRDQPDRHLRRDPDRRHGDVAASSRWRRASAARSSTWRASRRSTARSGRRRTPPPRAASSA